MICVALRPLFPRHETKIFIITIIIVITVIIYQHVAYGVADIFKSCRQAV
jgi:hypothetical protein